MTKSNDQTTKEIKKTKRGRKPNNVVNEQVTKKEDDMIIVKMPLQLSDLVEDDLPKNESETEDLAQIFISSNENDNNNDNDSLILKKKITELEKIINDIQNEQIGVKNRKITNTNLKFSNNKNKQISWPEKTDCRCWWDKFKFSTSPVPIPLMKKDNEYVVADGYFCSFNCALSYLLDKGGNKSHEQITLLHQLYRTIYDNNDKIYPAPDWKCINEYGRHLTIDEFRNKLLNIKKEYIYLLPPIKSLVPQIEESNRNEVNEIDKVSLSINSIDSVNLTKLKRSKPIVNNKYQLDKTMGLTIKKKTKN